MRRLLGTTLVLIFSAAIAAQSSADEVWPSIDVPLRTGADASSDTAVVIGLEHYPYLKLPVRYARRDAEAFHNYLVYSRGVPPDRIRYLTTANRVQIEEALRTAGREVGEGGTIWVYFAGHGATSTLTPTPRAMLLADDARPEAEQFDGAGVFRDEIADLIGSRSHPIILVIDACSLGVGRDEQPQRDGARPAVPMFEPKLQDGIALWRAASEGQVAGPLAPVEHGAFTYFVVGALRGWADGEISGIRDGEVTAAEAEAYVGRAVRTTMQRSQEPVLTADDPGSWVFSLAASETGPDLQQLRLDLGSREASISHEWNIDYGENITNEMSDDTGYLFVSVDPRDATIFINGEEVGSGRFQGERPVGHYRVVAELGELFYPQAEDVELSTGKTKLAFRLEPAFGAFHVTSDPPGAEVWLDGELLGNTPHSNERKKSGHYDLRVALPEYLSDSRTVLIEDRRPTEVHALLEPNWGALEIRSEPSGASISLDGQSSGQYTPHRFERVTAGVAEVGLFLEGYGESVHRPRIERQQVASVQASLQPKLGVLSIESVYRDGTPCEGTATLDGEPQSDTTPLKLELPAREYEVSVRCGDNTGTDVVRVIHGEKTSIEVAVVGGTTFFRGENIANRLTDETGFLVIEALPPEAAIYVNGEEVGHGSVQVERMSGDYVVTAELGDMYHPDRAQVTIGTGTERVALELAVAHGELQIESEPTGADVFLDEQRVGATPYTGLHRSLDYRLRVALEDHVEETESITVRDGRTLRRRLRLEPDWGELVVTSDPPGAVVTLNGESTDAVTPHRFERVRSGYAEIGLSLEGYGDAVATPDIRRQQLNRVDLALQPKLGMMIVKASHDGGVPCEGQVAVDGILQEGTTPFKDMFTACEHHVQVRCGQDVGQRTVEVQHNERALVELVVEPGGTFSASISTEVFRRRFRNGSKAMMAGGAILAGTGFLLSGILYAHLQVEPDEAAYGRQRQAQIGGLALGITGTAVGLTGGVGFLTTLKGKRRTTELSLVPGPVIAVMGSF